jgi:hypothetical protein
MKPKRGKVSISPATRRRIERELRNWDRPSPATRKRREDLDRKWQARIQPLLDAIERSERLTAEDFAIRINI